MKKINFIFVLISILFSAQYNTAQTLKSGILNIKIKTDTIVGQKLMSNDFDYNIELNSNFWTYPDAALKGNIQGNVYFTVTIDSNCHIDSIKIDKGLGYGLDEITVKILRNLDLVVFNDNQQIYDCKLLDRVLPMRKFSSHLTFTLL